MIWTIIYQNDNNHHLDYLTKFGCHGASAAMKEAELHIDGEIIAIVAGKHNIHFNKVGHKNKVVIDSHPNFIEKED